MSCAEDDVDCAKALAEIYEYIDGEMDTERLEAVQSHIDGCSHCLGEYGVEQEIKTLVARSCACSGAPEELRQRILAKITQVRLTASFGPNSASASISIHTSSIPPQ